jgi:hypothetical protein
MKNRNEEIDNIESIQGRWTALLVGVVHLDSQQGYFIAASFKGHAHSLLKASHLGHQWIIANGNNVIGVAVHGPLNRIRQFLRCASHEFAQSHGLLLENLGYWSLVNLSDSPTTLYKLGSVKQETALRILLSQLSPTPISNFLRTSDLTTLQTLADLRIEDEPQWSEAWLCHLREKSILSF